MIMTLSFLRMAMETRKKIGVMLEDFHGIKENILE